MSYNEKLADKIRKALVNVKLVEEKKMFGGLAFMVNDKLCITVRKDRIMCRIDPAIHELVLTKPGVTTTQMKGRDLTGYVYVSNDVLQTKEELKYWINLALEYNKSAKASRG